MFLLTQFIGLIVINADVFHITAEINGTSEDILNPYLFWIAPPEVETQQESVSMLGSLIISFILAVCLLFFLSKLKIEFILKAWFFFVVTISLFLTFLAFEKIISLRIELLVAFLIAGVLAIVLAFLKIYGRNMFVHNITELLIYPGIAAVFVPILNVWTMIILLVLISGYDMWAVWHSGIMQKMAKYQMNKLNLFAGFFVPYASGKTKVRIKKMKATMTKSQLKNKKIKVNVAILGGGDVVFPIIAAGVMRSFSIWHSLFVIAGAILGLSYLFFFAEKKKFYPAMPYISAGIFLGMILSWIFL